MNICVLAGAGAEIGYGLSCGKSFAKSVLGINENEFNTAIKRFYKELDDDWFPGYISKNVDEKCLLEASLKKKLMTESEDYYNKKDFEAKINSLLKNLKPSEKELIMNDYTSYMGLLDEKFHTLIYPKALGPQKFWFVLSCYWRAYLLLSKEMLKVHSSEYCNMMENPKETYERMKNFAKSFNSVDGYYKEIRECRKNIYVVTTNYTPLSQEICELNDNDISFVHGSFRWFEKPKMLEVIDVFETDGFAQNDYFPFILIQSGVKPIIDNIQIKELAKSISFFENADRIIILGYRANCDDNHINSLLRKCVKDNKEVIYLDFDRDNKASVLDALRLSEEDGLIYRKIDNNNSLTVFREFLNDDLEKLNI